MSAHTVSSFRLTARPVATLDPQADDETPAWTRAVALAALTPSLSSLNPHAEVWERRLHEGWLDRNGDNRGQSTWPKGTSEAGLDSHSDSEVVFSSCSFTTSAERPAR